MKHAKKILQKEGKKDELKRRSLITRLVDEKTCLNLHKKTEHKWVQLIVFWFRFWVKTFLVTLRLEGELWLKLIMLQLVIHIVHIDVQEVD